MTVGDKTFIVVCLCLLCISSVWFFKASSKALFMVLKAKSEFICQNWFHKCSYLLLAIHMVTYNYFLRLVTKTCYLISGLIRCFFEFSGLSLPLFLYSNANVCYSSSNLSWKSRFRFSSSMNFPVVTTVPIHTDSSAVLVAGEFFNPMLCLCIQLHMGVETKLRY